MQSRPWLKGYGSIPADIDANAYPSVVAMLEEAMTRFASKEAFKCVGQTLTFAEVDRQSRAFAAYLQERLGVKKGDRIALMSPNFIAFPIAMLGIARAGAVQVNVNPLYTPRELEHQLHDAGVKVLLAFSGVSGTVAEVVSQENARVQLDAFISIAPGDGTAAKLPSPPVDARLAAQAKSFADVLAEGAGLAFTPVELNGDDLLFLQYTGGTTGLSKGAALSHRNLVANVQQFKAIAAANLRPGEEVVVTAIPLYHIFALMVNFISYFSVGATNWLVPNPRDMDGFIEVMKASRCTVFTGVNTLFAGLLAHPRIQEVDFSRLRMTAGGGAAVIEATAAKWKERTGTFIREGYGLSETSPVVSFNLDTMTGFTGTTGVPVPSTEIRLVGEDGKDVGAGEAGEVCVRGPQVMRGYWQQDEANASAFTEDGFFKTGDVGVLTPEGQLKIVDRKKDMILVSGFNVFPNEIEAVASGLAGVAECACIGVPDDKSGEAVQLFVVRAPGSELTAEAVIAHCRKEMTAYKVPRQVTFLEALPKSTVGKILRRELRVAG